LAIASTCALTFVCTFSISSNLVYTLIKKINLRYISPPVFFLLLY
jgi:hypothetical protein